MCDGFDADSDAYVQSLVLSEGIKKALAKPQNYVISQGPSQTRFILSSPKDGATLLYFPIKNAPFGSTSIRKPYLTCVLPFGQFTLPIFGRFCLRALCILQLLTGSKIPDQRYKYYSSMLKIVKLTKPYSFEMLK